MKLNAYIETALRSNSSRQSKPSKRQTPILARAVMEPKNIEAYADSLHHARAAEHLAVTALTEHRKEHGW